MGGAKGGSRPRLLVLGAGRRQLGLIRAARGRDLFVIACERDPNAPGFEFADRRAILPRIDEVAVGRLALAERVDAVVATDSDPSLAIASRLSERLGLPLVHSVEVASMLASRRSQQEALSRAGLLQAGWSASDLGDLVVTALVIDGDFYPLAVTDRQVLGSRTTFRGSMHVLPSDQSDVWCIELARRAIETLEIRSGAVRIDLVLAGGTPAVLGVLPGCTGEPEEQLCKHALHVDLPDLMLRTSLGERIQPPSLRMAEDVHACVRLFADEGNPASQPIEDCMGFARAPTREAALQGAMNAALRVRFRGAEVFLKRSRS